MPSKKLKRNKRRFSQSSKQGYHFELHILKEWFTESILLIALVCCICLLSFYSSMSTTSVSSLQQEDDVHDIVMNDIYMESDVMSAGKSCRIQSGAFIDDIGGEYIHFEGCRIVPTTDDSVYHQKVELMSNEEKNINEIMAQLQNNDAFVYPPSQSLKKKKKKKKKKNKQKKVENETATMESEEVEEESESVVEGDNVWKPRRSMNEGVDAEMDHDHGSHSNDNEEIDSNLLGMYERGFDVQLNKMHYASDAAYEQIMEDISTNRVSQSDIYHKYHIDFIPDESSFRLMPPSSIYIGDKIVHSSNTQIASHSMDAIRAKMRVSTNANNAFERFYAFTKMQNKYLRANNNEKQRDETKTDKDKIKIDVRDIQNMNVLRTIYKSTPRDILNVILNDDKLPQWLYESDTILDINCGIGDNLIYLLHNFTTINGICVVGTNEVKYKYAKLNVQMNGLSDRIEVINKDMYDPIVISKYNYSDVVYLDFDHNADEEYLQYFASEIMNNAQIRASKPGRILLSYNKLLFDSNLFRASYTLHFASGYHSESVGDVSVYMYSIPFYLSKLSSLGIDGNYAIFYGYQPMFNGLDLDAPIETDDLLSYLKAAKKANETAESEPIAVKMKEVKPEKPAKPVHTKSKSKEIFQPQTKSESDDDWFAHLNHAIFSRVTSGEVLPVQNEDAIFEIISSGVAMSGFDEIGEIQQIWGMISSQLLYQSFLNCLQSMIRSDWQSDKSDVLVTILNAIHDQYKEQTAKKQKTKRVEDEWQYLERNIFDVHSVDTCALYQYIFDEWQSALKSLLKDFSSLFFYESVKDSVESRMKSLFDNCT